MLSMRSTSRCRFVVLTGGPGAGKTAILDIAARSLGQRVVVLPEAASILFGGGFWRSNTAVGRKAAQRAIYYVQREQQRMVIEEEQQPFVLCDRGTLDGLAYWPDEPSTFWQDLDTSSEVELARYDAVIHLRTPSQGQGYNHQNPLRTEDAARAAEIDESILQIWSKHPRHFVINSSDDFLTKVHSTLRLIESLLRDPADQAAPLRA
jgi:predicted ATPase